MKRPSPPHSAARACSDFGIKDFLADLTPTCSRRPIPIHHHQFGLGRVLAHGCLCRRVPVLRCCNHQCTGDEPEDFPSMAAMATVKSFTRLDRASRCSGMSAATLPFKDHCGTCLALLHSGRCPSATWSPSGSPLPRPALPRCWPVDPLGGSRLCRDHCGRRDHSPCGSGCPVPGH